MNNIFQHKRANVIKTWFLMSIFLVILMIVGFFLSRMYGNPSILYGFFIFSMIMNLVSYWFSDKIAIKMSGAKPMAKNEFPHVYAMMEKLTQAANLPMPRLYVIDDAAPNAFATGRNKDNAAVAFTRGLLERLEQNEVEGVAAHELAHIGNRDILIQTVAVVLAGLITLVSDFLIRAQFFGGNDRENSHPIMMLVGIALAILSPIAAMLIQLAISRKREYLADATGAQITKNPEGLASALEKIASYAGELKKANHATAHMYISNPFGGTRAKRGFLTGLFMTHPPMQERVRLLRGMR